MSSEGKALIEFRFNLLLWEWNKTKEGLFSINYSVLYFILLFLYGFKFSFVKDILYDDIKSLLRVLRSRIAALHDINSLLMKAMKSILHEGGNEEGRM